MTAHECVSDVQHSSRLSPGSVCSRRKRRSQSIPTELAAPSASPYAERPTGWARSLEAGAANKVTPHQNVIARGEAELSERIGLIKVRRCTRYVCSALSSLVIHSSTIKTVTTKLTRGENNTKIHFASMD